MATTTMGVGMSETGGVPTGSGGSNQSVGSDASTSSSSTGSTDGGGSEEVGEPGCTAIRPDLGTELCDPFEQDCPPCQKCAPYVSGDNGGLWDATRCVPVAESPARPGEPCVAEGGGGTGIDSCEEGAYCWDVDDRGEGTCVSLCQGNAGTPTCPDPETTCHFTSAGVGLIPVCLDKCDPLANDCPPRAPLCLPNPTGSAFICRPDLSGDAGAVYDLCYVREACDPGLFCLAWQMAPGCEMPDVGCCLPFCDTRLDPDPGCDGLVCQPFYEEGMAEPGYEHVGYCGDPWP